MEPDDHDPQDDAPHRREPFFNPDVLQAMPVILLVASFVAIQLWIDYGGYALEAAIMERFAFWSGEFWQGRRLGTVVSYAFLHAGWVHLGMNGVACLALGILCWRWMGTVRFFMFFVATAAAGAVAFALVRHDSGPLVGASGAIFGLLGAVKRVEFRRLTVRGIDVRREVLSFFLQIVLLNVAISFAMGGAMAWEAHLGGLLLGWFLTPWMIRPKGSRI